MAAGIYHTVSQGECIAGIAFENGFSADTLWSHPENATLKEKRKSLHVLLPGDVVFIPELQPKYETIAIEGKHRFKIKGIPVKLRFFLLEDGEPRSHLKYKLKIDGRIIPGVTDGSGKVEVPILPNINQAELLVEDEDPITIGISHLDPVDSITGVQSRLRNLGFDISDLTGKMDERTVIALNAFQRKHKLDESRVINDDTTKKLKEIHGC